MGSLGESSQRVAFGEFELDLRTREVWVNGSKFDLQEQPFQVLSMLLVKPGELITREELTKRLWSADTFVDYEHALNRVVKRLREALNDSADEPRFIETLPRRGYRFIATVRQARLNQAEKVNDWVTAPTGDDSVPARAVSAEVLVPCDSSTEVPAQQDNFVVHPWHRRFSFLLMALGLGCLAGWLTYFLLSPPPTIRVVRSTKITTSSKLDPWGLLETDGSRIYFLQRDGARWNLAQTSVSGGDAQIVPTPFRNTRVLAVSPNRDKLLIGTFTSRSDRMPFWVWPVQGGPAMRVGDVSGYDAIWSPAGQQIIYGEDDGIYQVNQDGSNAHKFMTTDGRPGLFSWSPNGRLLRFMVSSLRDEGTGLWQVDSDGAQLQPILPRWNDMRDMCCGFWSPDGQYFFFLSAHAAKSRDIWVMREKTGLLQRRQTEPYRLTSGPLDVSFIMPSPNGRQLFALGGSERDEFIRYDLQTRQFSPLAFTTPAYGVLYSHDGKWIVYTTAPESILTRSRPDGSQPISLTPLGMHPGAVSWSPDATQLAVEIMKLDGSYKIVVVSSEGGALKEVSADTQKQGEPSWSPDGNLIAFSTFKNAADERASIQLFNVVTKEVSLLPGSVGLRSPHWSPDGRFLAAVTEDLHTVKILDIQTRRWTDLAKVVYFNGLIWSKDGKELFYQDVLDTNQPIFKIRVSDHRRELVTNMESFLQSGSQRAMLIGLTPDGSLIIKLDRGGADVYALDLDTR